MSEADRAALSEGHGAPGAHEESGRAADVAVVVASCDAYADLWEPFFRLFRRYWPDCPYPVYLGSNFRTYRINPSGLWQSERTSVGRPGSRRC